MAVQPKLPLTVVFTRNAKDEIIGKFSIDPRPEPRGSRAGKIVLINGYSPGKSAEWKSDLPQNGEEWLCDEVRDTKPDDPTGGAIIVKLFANLSREAQRTAESKQTALTPIYSVLKELDRLMDEPPDKENRFALAWSLRSLAETMALALGVAEAMRLFLTAVQSGYDEVKAIAVKIVDTSTTHPAWTNVEKLSTSGRVRLICLEAVLAWLMHMRENGLSGEQFFIHVEERYFHCPACTAKIRLTPTKWDHYAKGGKVEMECPVCGISGRALTK